MGNARHKVGEIVYLDRGMSTNLIYSGASALQLANKHYNDKFHKCVIRKILFDYKTIDRSINLYQLLLERTGNELYVEEMGVIIPNDPNFMFLQKKRR